MKRFFFLLLFVVNLQVVIQNNDFSICLLTEAYAQHMTQEAGDNCYDSEIGWYMSPFSDCRGLEAISYKCIYCGTAFKTDSERNQHEETCPQRPGADEKDHSSDPEKNDGTGNSGGGTSGGGTSGGGYTGGGTSGGGGTTGSGGNGHKVSQSKQSEAVSKAVAEMIKEHGTQMACNFGVQKAVEYMLGYVPSALSGNANTIYKNLSSSSKWSKISASDAGKYSSQGYIVVGVWYGPTGSPPSANGHIVLVRPSTNGSVRVMDTGYGDGSHAGTPGKRPNQSINNSFRPSRIKGVIYYYYK